MPNICLNSRDELLLIDIEKIAFLQANGNYTRLTYIGGQSMMLTMGLSKVEDMLRAAHPKNRQGLYLSSISMCKQKVVLSDRGHNSYSLSVPKELLKVYKNKISDTFASMNK